MKDIRRTLGITQREMAALLQISKSAWYMYENGYRELPTHALLKLSQIVLALEAPQYLVPSSVAASHEIICFPKTVKKLKPDKRRGRNSPAKNYANTPKVTGIICQPAKNDDHHGNDTARHQRKNFYPCQP